MSLGDNHGFSRSNIRQGGGRGTGEDHVDDLFGCIELFVYQAPNTRPKGYDGLKTFMESQGCEVEFSRDVPPELQKHQAIRITKAKLINKDSDEPIPLAVVKRAHRWAHQRNYLHSFFKPMYT